jgi:enamine deaminase RidA (YjgF/YER057c/UK114 family)
MKKRINVDSGRPLEGRAHYSRALRVNELVLQSGTTAIDRDGNVIGQDIRTQVRAVLDIAMASIRVANLHRGSVLSLEAHAVRGASDNIEWKKL